MNKIVSEIENLLQDKDNRITELENQKVSKPYVKCQICGSENTEPLEILCNDCGEFDSFVVEENK